jgi:NADH-quinone oxidoreductase subunit F
MLRAPAARAIGRRGPDLDLHIIGPLASPAERAAIDAVLDPEIGPPTGWTGGLRDIGGEGRAVRGGHAARSRRDLLLPALHALQGRTGWISQGGLNHICRRLTIPPAEAYGVATFYALFSTTPRPPVVVHVCDDISCRLSGADELCGDLERVLGPAGAPAAGGGATWLRSPCLGLCERAPAAFLSGAGEGPRSAALAPADAEAVMSRLSAGPDAWVPDDDRPIPQAGQPGLRLLARVGVVDPASLEDYGAHGGLRALAHALAIGPQGVIDEIMGSRLVGRGGAAFPTLRKWAAVAAQATGPHFVVCNADESEPGTFKDRVLMERDPFAVLEGLMIAGLAVGADRGFLYVRGEYPLAEARLAHAISELRRAGLLGPDAFGAGRPFDVELRRGAGAYICGEETALFASIEGERGEPRNKPPFPTEAGLFGKPTAVNNVETLANVLLVLGEEGGGGAYARTGTEGSSGPKLFCLSGHVERPGLYEVAFGATLREIIELAGGVAGGRALKAVLLGGAAGTFVGPDALGVRLTFEDTRSIGAALGSGVVMVFDETADILGTLRRIAAFFRDESCGQCVPCRIGTVRQEEALARLAAGRPLASLADEVALLREIGQAMRDASICGLGQTASSAVESALAQPGLVTA